MFRLAIVFAILATAFAVPAFAQDTISYTPIVPVATNTAAASDAPAVVVTDVPEIVGYAEPEPGLLDPTNDKFESVVLGIVIVVCLVMALLSSLVGVALVLLYRSAPPAVRSAVDYNLPYITERLDKLSDGVVTLASKTPNTFDDAAAKWFNDNFDAKVREIVEQLKSEDAKAHG